MTTTNFFGGRSRRDCGNLEAEVQIYGGRPTPSGRSRRDCGNLEAVRRVLILTMW